MSYYIKVKSVGAPNSEPEYWSRSIVSASQSNLFYNSGNIGIGVPAPLGKLQIDGNVGIGTLFSLTAPPTDGLIVSGSVGIGTTTPLTPLHVEGAIQSSSLRVAPVTPLATAVAGTFEYDGTSFYGTPIGIQRGIMPGMQYYVTNADRAGPTAASTALSILNAGCALKASRYAFEIFYVVTKSSANAAAMQFAVTTTTGTIASLSYKVVATTSANRLTTGTTTMMSNYVTTALSTLVTVTAASAAAASQHTVTINGIVDVSADVTGFNPQLAFSAVPTTSSILSRAHMMIYPLPGLSAVTNVGTWA